MTSTTEINLRIRFCRAAGCGALFWICGHCDRGQCYCSHTCREKARQLQRRAANRRYQRTETGRQAHRSRQRAYRHRRSPARVTDHGSRSSSARCLEAPSWSPRCMICGLHSQWINPFEGFHHVGRRVFTRSVTGASPNKYVFS